MTFNLFLLFFFVFQTYYVIFSDVFVLFSCAKFQNCSFDRAKTSTFRMSVSTSYCLQYSVFCLPSFVFCLLASVFLFLSTVYCLFIVYSVLLQISFFLLNQALSFSFCYSKRNFYIYNVSRAPADSEASIKVSGLTRPGSGVTVLCLLTG